MADEEAIKHTVGEYIVEDWATGHLKGTVAEAIDDACLMAKKQGFREATGAFAVGCMIGFAAGALVYLGAVNDRRKLKIDIDKNAVSR